MLAGQSIQASFQIFIGIGNANKTARESIKVRYCKGLVKRRPEHCRSWKSYPSLSRIITKKAVEFAGSLVFTDCNWSSGERPEITSHNNISHTSGLSKVAAVSLFGTFQNLG